jgi:flagellin
MAAIVHHNLPAGYARLNLAEAQRSSQEAIKRLSSGYRVNHPGEGTAAYSMSQRLKSDMDIYEQARRNAETGMALTRAIEASNIQMLDVLDRMRELSVASATDTMTQADRVQAQVEFSALQEELSRLANTVQINNVRGLATSGTLTFQTGIREGQHNRVVLTMADMRPDQLSVDRGAIDITTQGNAQSGIDRIETAMQSLIDYRTRIGSRYRELQVAFDVNVHQMENLGRTSGIIRDTDYATEAGRMVQAQVRLKASASILTQANEMGRLALELLRR